MLHERKRAEVKGKVEEKVEEKVDTVKEKLDPQPIP